MKKLLIFAVLFICIFLFISPKLVMGYSTDSNSILDSDIRGNYKYELIANKGDGCLLQIINLQENKIVWGQKYEIIPSVKFLDDKALMVVTRDDFGYTDNLLIYNIANGDILQKIQLHGGCINASIENGNIVIEEDSGSYSTMQYVLDSTNYDIVSTNEYTKPYSVTFFDVTMIAFAIALLIACIGYLFNPS